MNHTKILELVTRFEVEVFPTFKLVEEDAPHLNSFLMNEIKQDKDFLPKGLKKKYSGDMASYYTITCLKRMGCLSDLVLAKKITSYYLDLIILDEKEQEQVQTKVWEIVKKESDVFLDRYLKDIHKYVYYGNINNQLHQFVKFKLKQLDGKSITDIKKETLSDIKERIEGQTNIDLVNLRNHIVKVEKDLVNKQGVKKTVNKILSTLVDFYLDLHNEREPLIERYFIIFNRQFR